MGAGTMRPILPAKGLSIGRSPKRWIGVVGLVILGLGLMWLASEQIEEVRKIVGSTFQVQQWRILGWLLTLIATGAVFGLAARFARADSSESNVMATVVVGVLPLAIVAYNWTSLWYGWFPTIGAHFPWLRSEPTIVASCIVVGFLAGGVVIHRSSAV